jgi:thioredoxin 1
MNKEKSKNILSIPLLILFIILSSCGRRSVQPDKDENKNVSSSDTKSSVQKFKVTFIELGSVKCIPCQQMQTVMKSVEEKYGSEVKIDFHDVWTEAGKPYGIKYGIDAIPTQIFLDESGIEYFRHVGFFPEEELVKILQLKGVKIN